MDQGVALPANDLAHVRLDLVADGEQRYLEISTTDERLVVDGYAMLVSVADRVQLDGIEVITALRTTLATWRSILATRVRMSPQAEIGLVGELLALETFVAAGAGAGIGCWRGAKREEHDFGFGDADVEVKTTSGERRQHWIHGLGQLVPTGGTPLWLVSVQITRAGQGQGRTLTQLVADLLTEVRGDDRASLVQALAEAGWRDEAADLFPDAWRLRSAPAAFRVDESFPRVTPAHLKFAGVEVGAIRQVTYEIDVTDRPSSDSIPKTLATALSQLEASLDDD
jgi:hypothetical protein